MSIHKDSTIFLHKQSSWQQSFIYQLLHHPLFVFIFCVSLSSLAYFYSSSFYNHWWLIWLAPIPLLLYTYEHKILPAFYACLLVGIVGATGIWPYLQNGLSTAVFLLFVFTHTLKVTGIYLLNRAIVRKTRHLFGFLAFPVLYVSFEYFMFLCFSKSMFGSIAVSQVQVLPLIQVARLTGAFGITFSVMCFASVIAICIYYYRHRISIIFPIFCLALVMIAVFSYGYMQLNTLPVLEQVKVAAIVNHQQRSSTSQIQQQSNIQLLATYLRDVRLAAIQGARIITLPDMIVYHHIQDKNLLTNKIAAIAKQFHIYINLGSIWESKKQHYHEDWLIAPSGKLLTTTENKQLTQAKHTRRHLHHADTCYTQYARLGLSVCHPMKYASTIRDYSLAHTGILLLPALNNNTTIPAEDAILNGVMGGYAVVRAAKHGLATISDSHGRILANMMNQQHQLAQQDILLASVVPGLGDTFYATWGNWFAFLCLVLSFIFLLVNIIRIF